MSKILQVTTRDHDPSQNAALDNFTKMFPTGLISNEGSKNEQGDYGYAYEYNVKNKLIEELSNHGGEKFAIVADVETDDETGDIIYDEAIWPDEFILNKNQSPAQSTFAPIENEPNFGNSNDQSNFAPMDSQPAFLGSSESTPAFLEDQSDSFNASNDQNNINNNTYSYTELSNEPLNEPVQTELSIEDIEEVNIEATMEELIDELIPTKEKLIDQLTPDFEDDANIQALNRDEIIVKDMYNNNLRMMYTLNYKDLEKAINADIDQDLNDFKEYIKNNPTAELIQLKESLESKSNATVELKDQLKDIDTNYKIAEENYIKEYIEYAKQQFVAENSHILDQQKADVMNYFINEVNQIDDTMNTVYNTAQSSIITALTAYNDNPDLAIALRFITFKDQCFRQMQTTIENIREVSNQQLNQIASNANFQSQQFAEQVNAPYIPEEPAYTNEDESNDDVMLTEEELQEMMNEVDAIENEVTNENTDQNNYEAVNNETYEEETQEPSEYIENENINPETESDQAEYNEQPSEESENLTQEESNYTDQTEAPLMNSSENETINENISDDNSEVIYDSSQDPALQNTVNDDDIIDDDSNDVFPEMTPEMIAALNEVDELKQQADEQFEPSPEYQHDDTKDLDNNRIERASNINSTTLDESLTEKAPLENLDKDVDEAKKEVDVTKEKQIEGSPEPEKQKLSKKMLYTVIGVSVAVLIALAILLASLFMKSEPEQTNNNDTSTEQSTEQPKVRELTKEEKALFKTPLNLEVNNQKIKATIQGINAEGQGVAKDVNGKTYIIPKEKLDAYIKAKSAE